MWYFTEIFWVLGSLICHKIRKSLERTTTLAYVEVLYAENNSDVECGQ